LNNPYNFAVELLMSNESFLDIIQLNLNKITNEMLTEIILRMIEVDPEKRPSIDVFFIFKKRKY
jgi:hypothetical protein